MAVEDDWVVYVECERYEEERVVNEDKAGDWDTFIPKAECLGSCITTDGLPAGENVMISFDGASVRCGWVAPNDALLGDAYTVPGEWS